MSAPSPQHVEDATSESPQGRRKRVRHWTAQERASHRVLEKQRRVGFNARLMELAKLLPALHESTGQLSKHVIVDQSIAYISELSLRLAQLTAERDHVVAEMSSLRDCLGMEQRPPRHPVALPSAETLQPALDPSNQLTVDEDASMIPWGVPFTVPDAIELQAQDNALIVGLEQPEAIFEQAFPAIDFAPSALISSGAVVDTEFDPYLVEMEGHDRTDTSTGHAQGIDAHRSSRIVSDYSMWSMPII